MPRLIKEVIQSANDTTTYAEIQTGLTVDGKSGWSVLGIVAMWDNATTVAVANTKVSAILSTVNSATQFGDDDEIARIVWAQKILGAAFAVSMEQVKENFLTSPRVTVQPSLYISCLSALTGQANKLIVAVDYEIVKLSDLEVMRLWSGGA